MNKIMILLVSLSLFSWSCNYIVMKRHLNINIDDALAFDQGGTFTKEFKISTADIINAVSENVNTKTGKIEKLEIETIQLAISLAPNNTANSIHNIHVKLGKNWPEEGESLLKFDTTRVPVNRGIVYVANNLIIFKGISAIKKSLAQNLVTGKSTIFSLNMSGVIPAGEAFRGTIKLVLKASMDVETCEKVPLGIGPSECMVIPIALQL